MYTIDYKVLGITEQNMEKYNEFCFLFYKSFLYTKEDYIKFMSTLTGIINKHSGDKYRNAKIAIDLSGHYTANCIAELRAKDTVVINKLIGNILVAYSFDNKIFEKSMMGGKRNFAHLVGLYCILKTTQNSDEVARIKAEINKLEKDMQQFRHSVIYGTNAKN